MPLRSFKKWAPKNALWNKRLASNLAPNLFFCLVSFFPTLYHSSWELQLHFPIWHHLKEKLTYQDAKLPEGNNALGFSPLPRRCQYNTFTAEPQLSLSMEEKVLTDTSTVSLQEQGRHLGGVRNKLLLPLNESFPYSDRTLLWTSEPLNRAQIRGQSFMTGTLPNLQCLWVSVFQTGEKEH